MLKKDSKLGKSTGKAFVCLYEEIYFICII